MYKHRKKYQGLYTLITIVGVRLILGSTLGGTAFAETVQEHINNKINFLNVIMQGIYLLLRPLLFIAGQALDNRFIYGEFINLDTSLRTFRNITKNLANFTLGFMILREILKNVFNIGKKGSGVFDIIKRAVIAGIGIQASWFIMAALLDISTIATYSIGGLPINVLNNTDIADKIANQKVLGIEAKLDLSNTNQSNYLQKGFQYFHFSINNNNEKIYYSPCRLGSDIKDSNNLTQNKGNYIIGRLYGYPTIGTGITFKPNRCILYGNSLVILQSELVNTATSQSDYSTQLYSIVTDTGANRTGREANSQVININKKDNYNTLKDRGNGNNPKPGIYSLQEIGDGDDFANTQTFKTILEQGEGFLGPLALVYNSLLQFADLTKVPDSTSDRATLFNFLIKAVFAIALFVPLIFTAIVLILRIGYLWLYIILSPFIILFLVFKKDNLGKFGEFLGGLVEDYQNILRIIFAPVIITFTLSLSVLFLSILSNSLYTDKEQTLQEGFGITSTQNGSTQTFTIPDKGFPTISLETGDDNFAGFTLDPLARFIMNIFGIAVMWFLVFAALQSIKMKWPGTDKNVVDQGFAAKTLGSIPIIPVPTKEGTVLAGANTALEAIDKKVSAENLRLDQGARSKLLGATSNTGVTGTSGNINNTQTTAPTFNTQQVQAIATGLSQGLTPAQIKGQNQNLFANIDESQIPTEVISNETLAKEFIEQIQNEPNKEQEIDKRVKEFRTTLKNKSKEEVENIFNRGDELAQRVAPAIGGIVLELNGKKYEVTVQNNGRYKLIDAADPNLRAVNENYNTIHQTFNDFQAQQQAANRTVSTRQDRANNEVTKIKTAIEKNETYTSPTP